MMSSHFRFKYGTALDQDCEQGGKGLFKFSVELICAGQATLFRCPQLRIGAFIHTTYCLQTFTGLSFISSASRCYFNVSAGTEAAVFTLSSQEFEITSGTARTAMLLGNGPFCASAGAIVWSVNSSSDGLCLVAQLQDAEGNNVTSAVRATVKAWSVGGLLREYSLSRTTLNTSSATTGVIRWCDAYSSRQQNESIIFGASVNGNITYWTSSVIDVSSAGPPANLLPKYN